MPENDSLMTYHSLISNFISNTFDQYYRNENASALMQTQSTFTEKFFFYFIE